jgi:platelet-activating factor acetylhydrolase
MPRFRDEWIEYKYYYNPNPAKEFPLRNKQVLQRSRDAILALELLTKLSEGVDVNNMMDGDFDFKQFQGRLDISKAAIMGHSFGGATTIQALSEDQRFLCGIAMDCWMLPIHRDLLEAGVHQPLLFINSSDFQWAENVRKMMQLTHPPQYTGAPACTILTLKGTSHATQTDALFVLPKFALRWGASSLDPTLAHRLNMDICHAFFKRYQLRDATYLEQNVPNLDGGEGHSEHIIFGTNVDLSVPSDDESAHPMTVNEVAEQGDSSASGTQGDTGTLDGKNSSGDCVETTIKNADELVGEFTASGEKTEEKESEEVNTPVEQAAKL